MLTKLKRFLYDEAYFTAAMAVAVRLGIYLAGVLLARGIVPLPPRWIAMLGGPEGIRELTTGMALAVAAGNRSDPPPALPAPKP